MTGREAKPRGGDVAIVGMACLFPGAPNKTVFWSNILNKVCAISDPPEEWRADLYYDSNSRENDRVYCTAGGYLKELAAFDPLEYGVMPLSVDGSEPDQFLALRVANEALADAGYLDRPFNRERTAVIIGRGTYFNRGYLTLVQHGLVIDQTLRLLRLLHPEHTEEELLELKRRFKACLPPLTPETVPGLVPNIMCGRVMNRLDLMGTSYTIDAACASSLIALGNGLSDLQERRCDMAIVGGVQVSTPALIYMVFCQLNALSRRGQIRPFDKNADGTLLGEGLGMVVLKRREDAERDGDRIYTLVRAVGTASDGRALGLLAPRVEGEEKAIRRAYEEAGIAPETIGLLEAHGTATAVGDATEIEAIRRVFGPPRTDGPYIALGSVKSMIGHIIPASGIASVIKTALALHHRILPPMLCDAPNPALGIEQTACYINTEPRPWIHGGVHPRRAGVNAFGFGGINAHAILEEYDSSLATLP
jgi:acyl transferase domain-containing protein